jgi:hypothetical protein
MYLFSVWLLPAPGTIVSALTNRPNAGEYERET